MGLRLRDLGTDVLTIHDLVVIIKHLPPSSALLREADQESFTWTLEAHLLAMVADGIHWLRWAKTEDAEKGINQPEPIPRPGIEDPKKKNFGRTEGIDAHEMFALLEQKQNRALTQ